MNVNFRYVEDELSYLFDNADFKAVVYDREFAPRIRAVRDSLPLLQHLIHMDDGSDADVADDLAALGSVDFEDAMASGSPERDFGERSGDDHYVLYTGGTTGMPKGVVWRQEDVFYALGGGIDAYTNERVASEWSLAEKAKAVESPLRSLNLPPLMHGAAQWGFFRFAFEGNFIVFLRRFDPHEVWRTVEREGINNLSITGDAMARPMIEALEEMGGPDALDLSSLFVLASTAAIFSPTVKDQYLELFPNLMIIDAIGSSETGANGMRMVAKGDTQNTGGGPTVQAGRDSVVLDEDFNEIEPGTGVQGRLARRGNVPLEYYKDPEKSAATFVTGPNGMRYALAGDMAIHEADGTITLLGRGLAVHQLRRREDLPRGGRGRPQGPPGRVRRHRRRRPRRAVGPAGGGGRPARDGAAPPSRSSTATAASTWPATRCPRSSHLVPEVVRSPSGKPDYPWAGKVARGEIKV